MNKAHIKDQRGSLLPIIIIAVVVVIGAAGFAFWRLTSNKKSGSVTNNIVSSVVDKVAETQTKDACKKTYNDDNLCTFFSKMTLQKKYMITSTTSGTSASESSKYIMKLDGDKTYTKSSSSEYEFEMITIGDTTYTKAGDTWWKQSKKPTTPDTSTSDMKIDEIVPSEKEIEADKDKYEFVGKEACQNFTCFKYKVTRESSPQSVDYYWFDEKDYILRKMRMESADGVTEMEYSYDNISISEPSPVKELGPDEYIMPGMSEPMKMSM